MFKQLNKILLQIIACDEKKIELNAIICPFYVTDSGSTNHSQ